MTYISVQIRKLKASCSVNNFNEWIYVVFSRRTTIKWRTIKKTKPFIFSVGLTKDRCPHGKQCSSWGQSSSAYCNLTNQWREFFWRHMANFAPFFDGCQHNVCTNFANTSQNIFSQYMWNITFYKTTLRQVNQRKLARSIGGAKLMKRNSVNPELS